MIQFSVNGYFFGLIESINLIVVLLGSLSDVFMFEVNSVMEYMVLVEYFSFKYIIFNFVKF